MRFYPNGNRAGLPTGLQILLAASVAWLAFAAVVLAVLVSIGPSDALEACVAHGQSADTCLYGLR